MMQTAFNKTSLLLVRNAAYHQFSRGLLFSRKKPLSRDFIAWIQQPIDLSAAGILRWLKKKWWKAVVSEHQFLPQRHQMLGPDLATAHFVVARGGAIKFDGFNRWVKKNTLDGKYILPSVPSLDLRLEAVDVSDTNMMYVSFDNFVNLNHLKYLNVAGCTHIDDWCLDRFVQFRDTLLVLDVSRCPRVTERGLASLHKLHRLRRLRMLDMPAVQNIALTTLMLEEVLPAGCVIECSASNDWTASDADSTVPSFLKQYEHFVTANSLGDRNEKSNAKVLK